LKSTEQVGNLVWVVIMEALWIFISEPHDQTMTLCLLGLAAFRIWLEMVRFDFLKLPVTRKIAGSVGTQFAHQIHQWGLFFSIGYILLFAPGLLIS